MNGIDPDESEHSRPFDASSAVKDSQTMWAAIGICPLAASRRRLLMAISSCRVLAAGDTTALPVGEPNSYYALVRTSGVNVVAEHRSSTSAADPAPRKLRRRSVAQVQHSAAEGRRA